LEEKGRMKISAKLICTIEIMMLLVIITSSFAAFQLGNRIIGEQVNDQLESVIILKSNQLNSYFNERMEDIDSLSSSEDIIGLLPLENADRFQDREANLTDEKRDKLQERLNRYGNFVNFFIIDKNGEVYISTDKSQEGMLRSNSEYFIEGKKGLYADNLNYDLSKSRPTMMISAPILDDESELRAVFAGEVNLISMSTLMVERSGLGQTGETYLVNNYNFALTQLREDAGKNSDYKKFIYTRAVEDCLDKKPTAISSTIEYTDYSGDTVLGLYKYLPERETAIIAKIDREEAYAYSEELGNTIFVITCVIAAISLLIALFISRTISKPITKLTKSAEIIGKGNLEHTIESKTKDEVGELAAAFNKMTANLKETTASRDELNKEVAERKRAEEQIKASLKEKEVLLREIHHRVKNNLQVVSSLLSIQARTAKDKDAIDVLSESRNRINAMALIHTQLYESSNLSEINMKGFVDKLLRQLLQSYPVQDTKITPTIHVVDCPFPISLAVPVGLIVNELLSNALKHAFVNRKEGKIEVDLSASEKGKITLTVSDDGVGLPEGFDITATKTLGLRMVKILAEDQLQGNLEVISKEGTTFKMEFDIENSGGG
jgi:two-component sensor histidine kinase/HAMP domain-containing protein